MNFPAINPQHFGAPKPGADRHLSASQGQATQDWSSFSASLEESMGFREQKRLLGGEPSLSAMRERSPQQAEADKSVDPGDEQGSGKRPGVAATVQSLAAAVELARIEGDAGTLSEAAGRLETLIENTTEMNPAIEKLVQRILQAASPATGAEEKLNAAAAQAAAKVAAEALLAGRPGAEQAASGDRPAKATAGKPAAVTTAAARAQVSASGSSAGAQTQPEAQAPAGDPATPGGRLPGAEGQLRGGQSAGDRPQPQGAAEGASSRPARTSASGQANGAARVTGEAVRPVHAEARSAARSGRAGAGAEPAASGDRPAEAAAGKPAAVTTAAARAQVSASGSSAGAQTQPEAQSPAGDPATPGGRLRGAEGQLRGGQSAGDRPQPQGAAEGASSRPAAHSVRAGAEQAASGDRPAEATAGKPAAATRTQSEGSAPAATAASSRAEPITPPTASPAPSGSSVPQTAAGAASGGASQSFSDGSFSGFGQEGKGRQDGRESRKSGGAGESFGVERSAGHQAAGGQGKAAPAAAQVSQTMQRIVESIQTLQQQAHQSRINLSVDLKNGESLRVSLQIVKQQVKVVFSHESEAMRIALRENWDQLQKQVLQKGLDADLPEFEGEERDPRQEMAGENEDEGASVAFSRAEPKPLAGRAGGASAGTNERTAVRPETLLAPEPGIRRYA